MTSELGGVELGAWELGNLTARDKSSVSGLAVLITESGTVVNRTAYLHQESPAEFNLQRGARGTAMLRFIILQNDSYTPEIGQPVNIYDSGYCVFGGTVESIERRWLGDYGTHIDTLALTSYEACLDVLEVSPPRAYLNESAGHVVSNLVTTLASGVPFVLGDVRDGPLVNRIYRPDARLSDALASLATEAGFVWGVDPDTATLYFRPATVVNGPFGIDGGKLLWETPGWQANRADFRDRQTIQFSFDAATQTINSFAGDGATKSFALRFPADHLTRVYTSDAGRAGASGTFTAPANPGDAITVTPPLTASGATRQAGVIYQLLVSLSSNKQVAGVPFSCYVTGVDFYGSIVTSYTGPVHFTWLANNQYPGAGGGLPVDTSLTAGRGTVSVTLDSGGVSYMIVVTDAASPSIIGYSPVIYA